MIRSVSAYTKFFLKTFLTLLILNCTIGNGISQELWSTSQYLDFVGDRGDVPFEENLDFLNNSAKGMPWVDNYEFRTETDEMNLERQQYQLRFKFNSSDERKAYNEILAANKDKYGWLQAQYELEFWEERYSNIIDLFFLQKEMELLAQDLDLLTDKRIVLKKILDNNAQVDVQDWITNEEEIFNVSTDSLKLEIQKEEITQKVFGTKRVLPSLETTNFIGVQSIREMVSSIKNDSVPHPDRGVAIAEEMLASAEYKLEEAEGSRWLQFAQLEYQANDKVSFQNEISLSTSITLPSKNNNRVKKNEAALELLEKSYEAKMKNEENRKEILSEEAKLLSLIRQWEELKRMIKNQKLESIFGSLSENKIVSPLILIDIKISIVKNAKRVLRLEKDIYESYIKLLSQNASFLKKPRINFLAE